ncbi:uncharacterized protein LOC142340050 [Convolutriloba macropyga]|uniref:uncharacterized protein LOC142340050 n=1 Tax=Convolutriloba macropyga TaxID=536237 RepID=UPI003F526788
MSCPNFTAQILHPNYTTDEVSQYSDLTSVVLPWVTKIIQWLICVVGVLGNGSVIIIYNGKPNRTPSENFILTMGIFDISMCFLTLSFTSSQDYLFPINCFAFCASGNLSFDFVNTSSSFLMMFITVNRYIAVCRPHSYKTLFSRNRTLFCIVLCLVLGICNSPIGILMCSDYIVPDHLDCACYEVIQPVPEVDILKLSWVVIRAILLILNGSVMVYCYCKVYAKMMERIKSRGNKGGMLQLRNAVEAEDTTVPTTIAESKVTSDTTSKNGITVAQKGRKNQLSVNDAPSNKTAERKASSGNTRDQRSRDQKLTTTLFVVSVAYVILVTPDLTIHVVDVFSLLGSEIFDNTRTVTQTLYLINFVINPFIHLFVNSYFKAEFHRRFVCSFNGATSTNA